MYKLISHAVIIACMCSSVALSAYEPVPPPPDPDRLSAATALVALMPVETALRRSSSMVAIKFEVEKHSLAWMKQQPDINMDETLEHLFRLKVRKAVEDELSLAVSEVAPSLAGYYAHRLSRSDIEVAIAFVRTGPGLNYMTVQLENDDLAIRLVKDHIYKRILPKFPQILLSAMESRAILERLREDQ